MKKASDTGLVRIGVFIDGTYFSRVSNYYLYEHERRSRLSITGLHEYIREEIARLEGVDKRFCQIIDAHYFRGRLNAKAAQEKDVLFKERQWDDVLIREGVTMHFLPLAADRNSGELEEKGVDVWFALEAFELAMYKRFDVSVLITGDGDFVPLVRKLNTLGTRVMLLAWDFDYVREGKQHGTHTSQNLINEVTYAVLMSEEIDTRGRKKDPILERLFLSRQTRNGLSNGLPVSSVEGEEDPEDAQHQVGTVVSLQLDKGYGFIRPDAGGDNLFFHFSSLIDCELSDMQTGDSVTFLPSQTERGLNAVDVRWRPKSSDR
jgi:uncharacterized LabA/DUF88 family protein/cold shock CspA family protein